MRVSEPGGVWHQMFSHHIKLPPDSIYKLSLCRPLWLQASVTKMSFEWVEYESKWYCVALPYSFWMLMGPGIKVRVIGCQSAGIESLAEWAILHKFWSFQLQWTHYSPTEASVTGFRSPCYISSLMNRLTMAFYGKNTGATPLNVPSSIKRRKGPPGPSPPRKVWFLLTTCAQALSSLTSDGLPHLPLLLLVPSGWLTYSVLPAGLPSLTCCSISLERLLPLALLSFPPLPQICPLSLSCCWGPSHGRDQLLASLPFAMCMKLQQITR